TVWISSTLTCYGGILLSSSSFPYRTPTPVGPYILCPENAKKSTSSACTSTATCCTACAPSTSTGTSWLCAISIISFTGLTVPSALETYVKETSFVCSENNALYATISNSPLSFIGMTRSLHPFSSHSICHGTILE